MERIANFAKDLEDLRSQGAEALARDEGEWFRKLFLFVPTMVELDAVVERSREYNYLFNLEEKHNDVWMGREKKDYRENPHLHVYSYDTFDIVCGDRYVWGPLLFVKMDKSIINPILPNLVKTYSFLNDYKKWMPILSKMLFLRYRQYFAELITRYNQYVGAEIGRMSTVKINKKQNSAMILDWKQVEDTIRESSRASSGDDSLFGSLWRYGDAEHVADMVAYSSFLNKIADKLDKEKDATLDELGVGMFSFFVSWISRGDVNNISTIGIPCYDYAIPHIMNRFYVKDWDKLRPVFGDQLGDTKRSVARVAMRLYSMIKNVERSKTLIDLEGLLEAIKQRLRL